MAPDASERVRTPSPSGVPLPESPAYSCASTANPLSTYNLPMPPPPRPSHTVLTKSDLEQSQHAYSDLLATAKSYRLALASLSSASSAFGSALEACARLKESRADSLLNSPTGGSAMPVLSNSYTMKGTTCTADHLLSTSGVHYLIANHQQILSETVYRSFEVPLLHDLDKWRRDIEDAESSYQKEVALRSKDIRRLEKDGLKLHKQRRRDLSKFREHLVDLTTKIDELSSLHGDHAHGLLRESQEVSTKILDASCSLVRAEVDIFEGLARKGWTGGGLDELLERGRDLFAADDDTVPGTGGSGSAVGSATNEGPKLFSILPPKSILADTASDSGTRGPSDSFLTEAERYQSLAGAFTGQGDMDSIFSDFNHSRGVRPFSPQPIRRLATDVVMDPEALVEGEGVIQLQHRDDQAEGETRVAKQDDNEISYGGGEEKTDHDDDVSYDNDRNIPLRPTNSRRDVRTMVDEGRADLSPAGGLADPIDSPWKNEGLRSPSVTTAENI